MLYFNNATRPNASKNPTVIMPKISIFRHLAKPTRNCRHFDATAQVMNKLFTKYPPTKITSADPLAIISLDSTLWKFKAALDTSRSIPP